MVKFLDMAQLLEGRSEEVGDERMWKKWHMGLRQRAAQGGWVDGLYLRPDSAPTMPEHLTRLRSDALILRPKAVA